MIRARTASASPKRRFTSASDTARKPRSAGRWATATSSSAGRARAGPRSPAAWGRGRRASASSHRLDVAGAAGDDHLGDRYAQLRVREIDDDHLVASGQAQELDEQLQIAAEPAREVTREILEQHRLVAWRGRALPH